MICRQYEYLYQLHGRSYVKCLAENVISCCLLLVLLKHSSREVGSFTFFSIKTAHGELYA